MNEIDFYPKADETSSDRKMVMPKNIQGLSTPEEFEKIVVNDFLEPYNMITLDRHDIKSFCNQQGVFDALRIESSLKTLGEDVINGIRKIRLAHDSEKLQSVIFQITAKRHDMFTLDMMKSVNTAFCELEDYVEIKWGLTLNQNDMKAECGIYIIANFK